MPNKFELDESFEYFLKKFGKPFTTVDCPLATVEKFRGKLPDRLLEYWQEYGFCGFQQGVFWTVNPDDYEAVLDEWLDQTDIPDNDIYHVFARNAFGDLFLWGEETGYKYKITAAYGWVIEKKGNIREKWDFSIQCFFGGASVKSQDIEDEHGKLMFNRCIKKFGALADDEMFGFEPSLMLGGESLLSNISKVNIHVHLSILAQLGKIEILDNDGLLGKAFS